MGNEEVIVNYACLSSSKSVVGILMGTVHELLMKTCTFSNYANGEQFPTIETYDYFIIYCHLVVCANFPPYRHANFILLLSDRRSTGGRTQSGAHNRISQ